VARSADVATLCAVTHPRHRSRGRLAAVVACLLAGLLATAGCGAGNNAQSRQSYGPVDGNDATVGDVLVRNLTIVGAPSATDAAAVGGSAAGAPAVLLGTFASHGTDDQLTEVTVDNKPVTLSAPIDIPAGGSVSLPLSGPRQIRIDGVQTGSFASAKLSFRNAGDTELHLLVVPATGAYESVSPTVPPTTVGPTTSP
jgi:hypothetical protein